MRLRDDGSAEYTLPGRAGHVVHFWAVAQFQAAFSEHFECIECEEADELESEQTGKRAYFTIMSAIKRVHQECQ